ncbi:hypothetical protein HanPSC8_Chr17g0796791 [Helianthus annuus]|nr:hypothetical protein HanPSC8_Chr17g0796791 [Helianthus annuus]
MRNGSHFPDYLLKRILLGDHIEKIGPFADDLLNPIRVQKPFEPHSIEMTIRLHFEDKFTYTAETEAAMPSGIRQDHIRLAEMSVRCFPRSISMNGSPPAVIIQKKFERIQVVFQPKM